METLIALQGDDYVAIVADMHIVHSVVVMHSDYDKIVVRVHYKVELRERMKKREIRKMFAHPLGPANDKKWEQKHRSLLL